MVFFRKKLFFIFLLFIGLTVLFQNCSNRSLTRSDERLFSQDIQNFQGDKEGATVFDAANDNSDLIPEVVPGKAMPSIPDILPNFNEKLLSYWRMNGTLASDHISQAECKSVGQLKIDGELGISTFDGLTSFIECASGFQFALGEESITVSLWVKPRPSEDRWNMLFKNGSARPLESGYWLSIDSDTGFLRLWVSDGKEYITRSLTTTSSLFDSGWHHIGWTLERGVGNKLYVDGELAASDEMTSLAGIAAFDNFTIGGDRSTNGNNFLGSMDEMAIWQTPLNQIEIKKIFSTQREMFGF